MQGSNDERKFCVQERHSKGLLLFFFLKFKNSHVMSLSQKNLRKVTVGNTPDQKQFKINSKQIIINTFLND